MDDRTATAATQKLHFYQKGTFTVGNRLVSEADRSVQASIDRSNALTCGHRACQGCGEANMAVNAKTVADRAEAENVLTGALKSLFAVAEAYPELKANQNFLALQEELTSTENKIAFSRQFYNDSVMTYNTHIEVFPTNFIATMFNFGRRDFFEAKEPAERDAPKVSFQ